MLSTCVINVQQPDGSSSVFSRDTWIPIYLITFHSLQANKSWVSGGHKTAIKTMPKTQPFKAHVSCAPAEVGWAEVDIFPQSLLLQLRQGIRLWMFFLEYLQVTNKERMIPLLSTPGFYPNGGFFYSLYSFSEEIMGTLLHNHELVRLNNVFCSKWVLSWPLIAARRVFTGFL